MDILVDADVIAHQTCTSTQRWVDFGGDAWVQTFDKVELLEQFQARVKGIQDAVKEEYGDRRYHTVLCWSDVNRKTWRHDILPSYKANRSDKPKPAGFPILREWSRDIWGYEERAKLEADDVLGIRGSQPTRSTVIVTIDKDLKQIPGHHYNPDKHEFDEVEQREGRLFHMIQTLSGDPTDGYTGLPGYGPVKAHKLLDDLEPAEWWPAIVEAYASKGLTEADALVQAHVSHILTYQHYNKMTGAPILWTPEDYS